MREAIRFRTLSRAPAMTLSEPIASPIPPSRRMMKMLERTETPAARVAVMLSAWGRCGGGTLLGLGCRGLFPGHQELAGQEQGAVGAHDHPDEEGQHEVADSHPAQEQHCRNGQHHGD